MDRRSCNINDCQSGLDGSLLTEVAGGHLGPWWNGNRIMPPVWSYVEMKLRIRIDSLGESSQSAAILIAGALALLATGCDQQSATSEYRVVNGTVVRLAADTDCEMTVQIDAAEAQREGRDTVTCLLTNDTEVYVNDRFSDLDDIVMGDAVQLIGYRKSNPRGERFVLAYAKVTRNDPPPPPPNLEPPASDAGP